MADTREAFSRYEPTLGSAAESARAIVDVASVNWRNGMLVRATNWLGDTMMTLPAVYRLSRFLPDPCGLFVLCPSKLAPVWSAAPWVAHVVGIEGKRVGRKVAARIRELRAGIAVVLPNSFGSVLDVFGKGIPVRVGRGGRGRGVLLTHTLPAWKRGQGVGEVHQLSHYLGLAAAFGNMSRSADCPPLQLPRAVEMAAELGVTSSSGERWLALAPGAAYGPAKQWPVERFAEVAAWWSANRGRAVVVGTGQDRQAAEVICGGGRGCVNLAGRTGLTELMAVLTCVDAVLANDSGAMHLAAGLGTPGVAIFGSTDPVSTGPLGAPWVALRERIDCAPCFRRTCPRSDKPYHCLKLIETDAVSRALDFVLRERV